MNNDIISREALKEAVINNFDNLQAYFPKDFIEEIDNAPTVSQDCSDCKRFDFPFCEIKCNKEQMQELVDKAKTEVLASIERPQGEWAEFEGGYRCSNCDDIEVYTPNFCPNCGAKMKGGAE